MGGRTLRVMNREPACRTALPWILALESVWVLGLESGRVVSKVTYDVPEGAAVGGRAIVAGERTLEEIAKEVGGEICG